MELGEALLGCLSDLAWSLVVHEIGGPEKRHVVTVTLQATRDCYTRLS
jgi:hypothetical protein